MDESEETITKQSNKTCIVGIQNLYLGLYNVKIITL